IITRDSLATEQLNYIKRLCGDHVSVEEAAVDFRQPWMNEIVQGIAPRLSASTAETAGGEVRPEGTDLGKGLKGDEGIKRATGLMDEQGVVHEELAFQGTQEGLKYFLPGQLTGELDKQVHQDLAQAIEKEQIAVKINDRSAGAVFHADADGNWTGQGKGEALF